MKKDKFKLCSPIAILAFFFIIACANIPNLVGKWKEIGKAATLELWKDGTFKAVDNQKMAVNGKYSLSLLNFGPDFDDITTRRRRGIVSIYLKSGIDWF